MLFRIEPSPVVALNQAIAIGMRDGADVGLRRVDALLADGTVSEYAPAHAARADLLRRLGRNADARRAYERAIGCTDQPAEQRFFKETRPDLGRRPDQRGCDHYSHSIVPGGFEVMS